MSEGNNEEYLSTGQVARLLGVSGATIRRLADSGEIEVIKPFGKWRMIKKSSVMSFLESHPDLKEYAQRNS